MLTITGADPRGPKVPKRRVSGSKLWSPMLCMGPVRTAMTMTGRGWQQCERQVLSQGPKNVCSLFCSYAENTSNPVVGQEAKNNLVFRALNNFASGCRTDPGFRHMYVTKNIVAFLTQRTDLKHKDQLSHFFPMFIRCRSSKQPEELDEWLGFIGSC